MNQHTIQSDQEFPVLENLSVAEVRRYLSQSRSILIPVGITEQHGYHLPLCTDSLIATCLGREAARRLGMLLAPTFTQCYSGGELPGTINISPAVMSLCMGDMLTSLAAQGFRNFYLFLCHGGSENLRALNDALQMLLRNNPALSQAMIALLPVWKLSTPGLGWSVSFAGQDWHAGWLETSLVMHLAPGLVRMGQLELDDEPLLGRMRAHPDNYQQAEKIMDDPFVLPRISQRPDVRVGVMGDPIKASAELGATMAEDIIKNLAGHITRMEAGADGIYKPIVFNPAPIALV